MIEDVELFLNNRILQRGPLKKFLNTTLAKINPHMSMTQVTEEYYVKIFTSFIMPRVCFTYWDVMNDQENYQHWPQIAKADRFVEKVFDEKYEEDIRQKFMYCQEL